MLSLTRVNYPAATSLGTTQRASLPIPSFRGAGELQTSGILFGGDDSQLSHSSQGQKKPVSIGKFIRSKIRQFTSLLLKLVPKFVFSWLERRTLYIGSRIPALKTDLEQLKAQPDNSPELQEVINGIQAIQFDSSKGIQHHGWHFPARQGKPTFLLSMGNAWSMEGMLQYAQLMKEGYGFMTYEYPGYGSTQGTPNEKRLYASLEAASDYLVQQGVPVSEQIAYGVSLGGAVTTDVAARRPFNAVILESTFTSFNDMAKKQLKNWHIPTWLLPLHTRVQSKLDSQSKIKDIHAPLLILHGVGDPLIPSNMATKLFDNATAQTKKLQILPLGDHMLDSSVTIFEIKNFIEELPKANIN